MKNDKKIIELHPKKKGWRTVKITLLFLMVCAIGAAVYALRGDFSISGLKRLAGYFDFADHSFYESGLTIELERGSTAVAKPFKSGFAVVTADSVKYINGKNRTAVDEYALFSSPMLLMSDRTFLAYDQGGRQYVLANSAAALKNERTDGDIISAAVNDAGYYALVTDSESCRGSLTLYDNKQRQVFTWLTSTYYLSTAAISPSGRYTAVSCMAEKDGNFEASVSIIDSQSESTEDSADAVADTGSEYIYAISFLNENTFYVIKENEVALYTTDGELKGKTDFDGGIYAFSCERGDSPVIAAESYNQGHGQMILYRLNGKCEIEAQTTLPGKISFLTSAGKYAAAASGDSVYFWDGKAEQPEVTNGIAGLKDMSINEKGNILCVFADRAEILKS